MKKLLLLAILMVLCRLPVDASLKINELYPAPLSGDTEWVEIYNDEDTPVDITGYTIVDSKDNPLTFETNNASPSSYFLATATNVLNNSGDSILLKNATGETLDSLTYSESFSSDTSYSRCPDGSGSFIQTTFITKRSSNATSCVTPTQSATQIPTQAPTDTTVVNTSQSYDRVYISEVMVNPVEETEWIEVYNDNDFSVSLKNWFIDDTENAGSSPKSVTLDIPAKSYGVYELSSSMFNNSSDSVRLLDSKNTIKDSFNYYSSTPGNTLGKINPLENSICTMEPTKGDSNESCIATVTPTKPASTPLLTPTPTLYKISPYQTMIPTTKITVKPTVKKINPAVRLPLSLFEPAQQSTPEATPKTKGQVLGAKTDRDPLWKILAAIATSLSILTIIIILFRMKYRHYEQIY